MKNILLKIKKEWTVISILCKRFWNRYIQQKQLSERGKQAKEWAFKVATTGCEPTTYQEIMLEEETNGHKYTGEQRQQWYCYLFMKFSEY